ncbi:Sulfotransferase family protein [Sphingobium herbicidovorans NBRC 16415]|uniref:Sulfotransferase family protein n=1 Tax=Sphingobium herbicidovorans (strain ATCC 700291 / DSM 11019 / CCUG 56400 / KCTC 2939 / LMG 18315 / NBRC 16415 / MH) TaxID=1219045 RepID=A0A086P4I5_SPHHM|nr:sulfotransferase [Sphingobium herbicidovorans]KFG88303.1 Sulfotransferase family protein [Sphingobium herbicidovorans NBRC 16415]
MSGTQTQEPAEIRIDDMADPVVTPAIQAARHGPEGQPDRMTVDQVLAQAMADAGGLNDFGEDQGFRTRMAVTLQAWDEDEGLTRGGRITLLNHMVRVMVNRLRIEDLVKRRPEILDIEIDRPLFIAGLPRSGTTHLVNWLSRDERLRSLTLWESEEPVQLRALAPGEVDPRAARSAELWGAFEAMLPHMAAMHGMDAASIHEDNELLYMDLNCYSWEFQSRIPRWIDHYFAHDRTPSYAYEKKVLQVLTWHRGPNRWLLKSPQHMENLAAIKTVFPDATMVITHRDPIAVLRSLTTMLGYSDRIRRDPVDPPALARLWLDRIEKLLRACIDQREAWGPDQSADILFHEYMADQERVMRQVYRLADLDLTPEVEGQLLGYLEENPRNKHGKVIYDLEGVFGVDEAAARERFAFYYERFPVRQEA